MNPYEVLGITPESTPEEIKAAYRKAARANHPDHGGDLEKFKQVQQAYEELTDADEESGDWERLLIKLMLDYISDDDVIGMVKRKVNQTIEMYESSLCLLKELGKRLETRKQKLIDKNKHIKDTSIYETIIEVIDNKISSYKSDLEAVNKKAETYKELHQQLKNVNGTESYDMHYASRYYNATKVGMLPFPGDFPGGSTS